MREAIRNIRLVIGMRIMLWPLWIMPKGIEIEDYGLFMAAYFDRQLNHLKAESECRNPASNVVRIRSVWGSNGKPIKEARRDGGGE